MGWVRTAVEKMVFVYVYSIWPCFYEFISGYCSRWICMYQRPTAAIGESVKTQY